MYVAQEIVDTIHRNFTSNKLDQLIGCHMKLVAEHVESNHRAEDYRRMQFLFHEDRLYIVSAIRQLDLKKTDTVKGSEMNAGACIKYLLCCIGCNHCYDGNYVAAKMLVSNQDYQVGCERT